MKTILSSSFIWLVFCLLAFWPMGVYGASWEPSASFIAYMKKVEGFRATPYKDIGGVWHIGYGHKLEKTEYIPFLTEGGATTLLIQDIKAAYAKACKAMGYVPRGTYEAEVAVDYVFSGCGPKQFPKFFAYLKRGDKDGMRREYKRYCQGKELLWRDKYFVERYL